MEKFVQTIEQDLTHKWKLHSTRTLISLLRASCSYGRRNETNPRARIISCATCSRSENTRDVNYCRLWVIVSFRERYRKRSREKQFRSDDRETLEDSFAFYARVIATEKICFLFQIILWSFKDSQKSPLNISRMFFARRIYLRPLWDEEKYHVLTRND